MRAPQSVGGKHPDLNGLFDSLGNLSEWCWDLLDTEGYAGEMVFRGGGFTDSALDVQASVRRGAGPRTMHDDVGFRMARSVV